MGRQALRKETGEMTRDANERGSVGIDGIDLVVAVVIAITRLDCSSHLFPLFYLWIALQSLFSLYQEGKRTEIHKEYEDPTPLGDCLILL